MYNNNYNKNKDIANCMGIETLETIKMRGCRLCDEKRLDKYIWTAKKKILIECEQICNGHFIFKILWLIDWN